MPVDIKSLIHAVQKRIGNVTPSSPLTELEKLTRSAFSLRDERIVSFDSDAIFLDSANTKSFRMAYNHNNKNIYMWDSDNSWKPISGTRAAEVGFQGDLAGYMSAGFISPPAPSTFTTSGTRYRFASGSETIYTSNTGFNGPGPPYGNGRSWGSGTSSTTHGYHYGGAEGPPSPPTIYDTAYKFPFSSDTGNTLGSSLGLGGALYAAGISDVTNQDGYYTGGIFPPSYFPVPGRGNSWTDIRKFPFASNVTVSSTGALASASSEATGQTDVPGGIGHVVKWSGPPATSSGSGTVTRQKFPFASGGNATLITPTFEFNGFGGHGSSGNNVKYYLTGGGATGNSPSAYGGVRSVLFSSDATVSSHSDLTTVRREHGLHSYSGGTAFSAGGMQTPGNAITDVEGTSFANDTSGVASASSIGARALAGSTQV